MQTCQKWVQSTQSLTNPKKATNPKFKLVQDAAIYVFASICAVLTWLGLFYWMRLFSATSAYINLVFETLKDITFFLLLLLLCFGAFGNGLFILSKDTELQHPLYQLFVTQYYVATGVLAWSDFQENTDYPVLSQIMFIISLFISSITFLNMLIGIMGVTLGNVMDNEARFALIERTRIFNDYMPFVRLDSELKGKNYIYIVQKKNKEEDEQGEDQASVIQQIKHHVQSQYDQQRKIILNQAQQKEMQTDMGDKIQLIEDKLSILLDQQKTHQINQEKVITKMIYEGIRKGLDAHRSPQ